MSVTPQLIRRRVGLAGMLVLLLTAAPLLASVLAPTLSAYFPPYPVFVFLGFGIAEALFVWRTRWVVERLFPGQNIPDPLPFSAQERRSATIIACGAFVASVAVLASWIGLIA